MESRAKLSSTIYSSVVYSIGNHLSFEPSSTSTGGGVEVVFHRSATNGDFSVTAETYTRENIMADAYLCIN